MFSVCMFLFLQDSETESASKMKTFDAKGEKMQLIILAQNLKAQNMKSEITQCKSVNLKSEVHL